MAGKQHCDAASIRFVDYLLISNRSAWMNNRCSSCFGCLLNSVFEWEKCIACQHTTFASHRLLFELQYAPLQPLLVCPGPIPTVAKPCTITIAFDLTCSQTRTVNFMESICSWLGAMSVTTFALFQSIIGGSSV